MRVVHIIDAASTQATGTTLAMISDALDRLGPIEQEVVLLGGSNLESAAKAVGIARIHRVGVPGGRAWLAWPSVRRTLQALAPFDLFHCWSVGALTMTSLTASPRILTITLPPSKRTVNWLRTIMSEAKTTVVLAMNNTIRRSLISGGVHEEQVVVLRPAIDMGRIQYRNRRELRTSWGLDGDTTHVVAVLSNPTFAADAIDHLMTIALAAETFTGSESEICLLIHPDQIRRRRAEYVVQRAGRPYRILTDTRLARPWAVLPGCDLALGQGETAGGLSLLWAMASNVAIVAEATYAISEVLEDRHSALLVKPGERNAMAHRIEQILKDPQLSWRLRDQARHEAYSFFSRQRYCEALKAVYEQVVDGRKPEVPPLEPTGGLRFSGRG